MELSLKERARWEIRSHEEELSSLRAMGKELQGGRCQLDVKRNLLTRANLWSQ